METGHLKYMYQHMCTCTHTHPHVDRDRDSEWSNKNQIVWLSSTNHCIYRTTKLTNACLSVSISVNVVFCDLQWMLDSDLQVILSLKNPSLNSNDFSKRKIKTFAYNIE